MDDRYDDDGVFPAGAADDNDEEFGGDGFCGGGQGGEGDTAASCASRTTSVDPRGVEMVGGGGDGGDAAPRLPPVVPRRWDDECGDSDPAVPAVEGHDVGID